MKQTSDTLNLTKLNQLNYSSERIISLLIKTSKFHDGAYWINRRKIERSCYGAHFAFLRGRGVYLSVDVDKNLPLFCDLPPSDGSATSALRRRATWLSQYRKLAPKRSPRCQSIQQVFRARKLATCGTRPRQRVRNFVPMKVLAKSKILQRRARKKKIQSTDLDRENELKENEKKINENLDEILDYQSYLFSFDLPMGLVPESDRLSSSLGRVASTSLFPNRDDVFSREPVDDVPSVLYGGVETLIESAQSDVRIPEPPPLFLPPPPRGMRSAGLPVDSAIPPAAITPEMRGLTATVPVVVSGKKKKTKRVFASFD